RDRKPLLPRGQVATVEGVALFSGGKARVLTDGPRPPHVHGRVGTAHVGGDTGHRVDEADPLEIPLRVDREEIDAFRRGTPLDLGERIGTREILVEGKVGEIRDHRLASSGETPSVRSKEVRASITSWPAKRNPSTPASRSRVSSSPGRPARRTWAAPRSFRARAVSSASFS